MTLEGKEGLLEVVNLQLTANESTELQARTAVKREV